MVVKLPGENSKLVICFCLNFAPSVETVYLAIVTRNVYIQRRYLPRILS